MAMHENVMYTNRFKNTVSINFVDLLQVTNFGPSPVNEVELEFKIPVSFAEARNFIEINDIKVSTLMYTR